MYHQYTQVFLGQKVFRKRILMEPKIEKCVFNQFRNYSSNP